MDLSGKQFEDIFVLSKAESRRNSDGRNIKFWRVRCHCGKEYEVRHSSLKSGKSTKCKSCAYKAMQLNGKLSSSHYGRIKKRAKLADIPFHEDITREYLQKLFNKQLGKCAITKLPLEFSKNTKAIDNGGDTASLDRIDSTTPYQQDNIQWVHKDINRMKGSMTMEDFSNLCKTVTQFNMGKL